MYVIQPSADYVVTAEVGDQQVAWRNAAGVPVLTHGNPRTDVQVVVTQVVTPVITATPPPTPAPSTAPASQPDRTGSGNLLPLILLIAVAGALIAFLVARGRDSTDAPAEGSTMPDDTTGTPAPPTSPDAPAPTPIEPNDPARPPTDGPETP